MLFTRITGSLDFGKVKRKLKAVSNCWICEGWSEVDFSFKPKVEIDTDIVPVKVHISSDNYAGELLLPSETSEELIFTTKRALPPGSIKYYYTIDGV